MPCASSPTPRRKAVTYRRAMEFPAAKASEYPMTAQTTPTNPSAMKLIIIVFKRILRADQAAVEERQRRRHEQNKGSRDEHPCGIGLIHSHSPRGACQRAQTLRTCRRGCLAGLRARARPRVGQKGQAFAILMPTFLSVASRSGPTMSRFERNSPVFGAQRQKRPATVGVCAATPLSVPVEQFWMFHDFTYINVPSWRWRTERTGAARTPDNMTTSRDADL